MHEHTRHQALARRHRERAVELDAVDGERGDAVNARVPAAEIVDVGPDAAPRQRFDLALGAVDRKRIALDDLECERETLTRVLERAEHLAELLAVEVARKNV